MKKKGFYIRKGKDGSINLNLFRADFIDYLNELETVGGWIRLRIYEREKMDEKGHTHNMEQVLQKDNGKQ